MLGEKGVTRLFHCSCSTCGQSVLAVILETGGAISSVGLVTDMELKDAVRFKDAEAVSGDECISVHRLLEEGSRDLCQRLLDNAA